MNEQEEEYEEAADRQEEQVDDYEDAKFNEEEARRLGMAYPSPKESETLYHLFHKVLGLSDNSKTANLDKVELGALNMSVRDCQRIDLLATTLRHPKFGMFFGGVGEVTLRTSASKKGWFTELFVSQKKFTSKEKAEPKPIDEAKKRKWGFFKRF